MDIEKLRRDTPCENIYMNHGSTSVPPAPVVAAVNRYYEISLRYGGTSAKAERMALDEYQTMKERTAALVHAPSPDDIVFMPNGSMGINAVVSGLQTKASDNIVTDSVGFIANAAPLLRLRRERGIEVRFVPSGTDGLIDLNRLEDAVDGHTALVAITHSPNFLGILQPAEQIGRIAHRAGALYLLDAANTVGIAPLDVQTIGCDFLAAAGRKYLRGPVGSGFLYAAKDAARRILPCIAAWNNGTWDWRLEDWAEHTFIPNGDASRFAYGERDYAAVMGLSEALKYLREIGGTEAVRERSNRLLQRMMDGLLRLDGAAVYGPHHTDRRAGVLGFNIGGIPLRRMADYLNGNNVGVMSHSFFCPGACRLYGIDGATRISLHCWNTEREVDTVLALLRPENTQPLKCGGN